MTLDEEILKLDLIASGAFEGGDANEFIQLAEWLRELKVYREAKEEINRKAKSNHINMVAIKDLEMPDSCSKCPLFHYYLDTNGAIHFICKYGHIEISEDFKNKRSIFCPLIEVESEENE